MTHAIVLITNGGERLLLGRGVPEGDGGRLISGKYIDNKTFQRNYPESRIQILRIVVENDQLASAGEDEP